VRRLVLDHLEDIRDNAQAACEFVGAMTEAAFAADRKTLYAVLRALEVIGEAAKRVPAEVRGRYPDIDWRGMAGLRDIIIHQYDRIDHRVPFQIVTAQLPAIVERFAAVLAEERQLAGEASDPDDAAGEPST
jgi:uncharacterized protein with HEPN domain